MCTGNAEDDGDAERDIASGIVWQKANYAVNMLVASWVCVSFLVGCASVLGECAAVAAIYPREAVVALLWIRDVLH
jgi:hypothetical protein